MNNENYWTKLSNSPPIVYEYYGMVWIENVLVSKKVESFDNIRFFNLDILNTDFWLVGPEKNTSLIKFKPKEFSDSNFYSLAVYCDYTYRKYTHIAIL